MLPTTSSGDFLAFTPAKTGTWFSDSGRMQGRVNLVVVIYQDSFLTKNGELSQKNQAVSWPGIEPMTTRHEFSVSIDHWTTSWAQLCGLWRLVLIFKPPQFIRHQLRPSVHWCTTTVALPDRTFAANNHQFGCIRYRWKTTISILVNIVLQ